MRTLREEIANSITHGIGAALSVSGGIVLVVLSASRGTALHVVSSAIFGSSLVLLYSASTLYHAIQTHRLKQILKLVDHLAIFVLIAGTYTPFTLVSMRGSWGWTLFGLVWAIAILGIVFKLLSSKRFSHVSTALYLFLGWVGVMFVKPLMASIPSGAIAWLAAGGLSYTVGVIFYVWDDLPFGHTIWHVFVLAGSTCHYVAVVLYVLP